jgi:cytochrome P450
LDVISRSTFNVDLGFVEGEHSQIRDKMLEITDDMHFYVLVPFFKYIRPFKFRNLKNNVKYIRDVCQQMVTARREQISANGISEFPSIMDLMITRKDEEDKTLSDSEIVDNLVTFLYYPKSPHF